MRRALYAPVAAAALVLSLGSPVQASIPECTDPACGTVTDQVLTWDGSNVKRGDYVLINCYPYADSTRGPSWRSDRLPLTGSVVYQDGGYSQDLPGEVQCQARVYSKNFKFIGYPTPYSWRWITP
jgi:hypothetical protein